MRTAAVEVHRDVEWLPPLPPGWKLLPLWSMFERIKDVDHPDEEMLSVFRDHGVVARDSRNNLNQTAENRSIYQLVHPGWLVTNRMKAWQGSVGISPLRGIVSGHYICFAPRHSEDARYLNWLFRSPPYTHAYALLSRGVRTGQVEIDNDEYRLLPVLVPPLAEQRAIADYLDRETARIDALIEEQQRLIELLQERRSAVVDAVLAGGMDSSPAQLTGSSWIPALPDGWQVVGIKRLVSLGPINGISPEVVSSDGVKSLSLAAVRNGHIRFGPEVTKVVDSSGIASIEEYRLRADDILIVRGNGNPDLVGRAGLVGTEAESEEYIYPDLLIRVRVAKSVSSTYFVWACNASTTRAQIRALTRTAVGTYKVSGEMVRSLVVPLPPLDEQRRIAAYLDEQTAKIDTLIAETARFIELSRERRSALITAAVTGQIDVRAAA